MYESSVARWWFLRFGIKCQPIYAHPMEFNRRKHSHNTHKHTHERIRSFLLCLIKRARLSTPQMKKYTQTLFILHTYLIYTYLFVRYAVDILTPAQSDACTREYVRSSLFRKRAQGKFSSTRCLRPRTRQVDRNIVIGEKKKIDGKKHTHQQL